MHRLITSVFPASFLFVNEPSFPPSISVSQRHYISNIPIHGQNSSTSFLSNFLSTPYPVKELTLANSPFQQMKKPHLTLHDGKTPYSTMPSNHAPSPYPEHKEAVKLTLKEDSFDTRRHISNLLEDIGNSGRNFLNPPILEPLQKNSEERGRRMKVECPICKRIGILQRRGSSTRVIHYTWQNGKRIFQAHRIDTITPTDCASGWDECSGGASIEDLVTNKALSLVSVNSISSFFSREERARWDLNPRSPAPKAGALVRTWPRAPFGKTYCHCFG